MNNNPTGVKIACQRKLGHELGIPAGEVPVEKMNFLTRVHYKALTDSTWGEHEGEEDVLVVDHAPLVDYIIFIKCDKVTVNPNLGQLVGVISTQCC
jgi:isopentenyl-diphosphate delta-isomerase